MIARKHHFIFERWTKVKGLWVCDWRSKSKNLVPTQGLNFEQNTLFNGSAYTAGFFVGLIDNASFSAIALTDTAAQIGGSNGWLEFTGYSEGTRQTLTMGTSVAGSIDSSAAPAVFMVSTGFTLNGGFVITDDTKGGTAGVLYSATSNGSPVPFVIGQQVRIVIVSVLANG